MSKSKEVFEQVPNIVSIKQIISGERLGITDLVEERNGIDISDIREILSVFERFAGLKLAHLTDGARGQLAKGTSWEEVLGMLSKLIKRGAPLYSDDPEMQALIAKADETNLLCRKDHGTVSRFENCLVQPKDPEIAKIFEKIKEIFKEHIFKWPTEKVAILLKELKKIPIKHKNEWICFLKDHPDIQS